MEQYVESCWECLDVVFKVIGFINTDKGYRLVCIRYSPHHDKYNYMTITEREILESYKEDNDWHSTFDDIPTEKLHDII